MLCAKACCPRSGDSGSARITSTCRRTRPFSAGPTALREVVSVSAASRGNEPLNTDTPSPPPAPAGRAHPAAPQERHQTRRDLEFAQLADRDQPPVARSSTPRSARPRRSRSRRAGSPAPARRSDRPPAWAAHRRLLQQAAHRAVIQRLQGHRRRPTPAAGHPSRFSDSSGRARVRMKIGTLVDHSSSCSMKSNKP